MDKRGQAGLNDQIHATSIGEGMSFVTLDRCIAHHGGPDASVVIQTLPTN